MNEINFLRIDQTSTYEDLLEFSKLMLTCSQERGIRAYIDEKSIEEHANAIMNNREKELFLLLKDTEGKSIGSLAGELKNDQKIQLWSLFVIPGLRKNNIGKTILEYPKNQGYKKIYFSISEDNLKMKKLAERAVYKKTFSQNGVEERSYTS